MKEYGIARGRIALIEGDVTRQEADAIVNAANSRLAGGGGVDGAIHRAAGPRLMDACRALGGCPTGSAVLTPGFDLKAGWVIHAVGPIWEGGAQGEAELLRSAYRTCLEIAAGRGLRTIAIPSLSTGAYGYPMEEAAEIALTTAREHLEQGRTSLEEIRFVLYGAEAWRIFARSAEIVLRPGVGLGPPPQTGNPLDSTDPQA